MRYAVGIPTRNREVMLNATLEALAHQTISPEMVFVVDNNDEPREEQYEIDGLVVHRIISAFRTTGCEQGYQTALAEADRRGFSVFVKWDDDLIPTIGCLEKLVRPVVKGGVVAVGGMYPRPGEDRTSSSKNAGDGNDRHLQFFRWADIHRIIERRHLYSCYSMDVRAALRVGGFCAMYSRFGQRGETDFSLRLAKEGRLIVDTSAVAEHHWSPGGRRFSNPEISILSGMDCDLFRRRMIEYKLDPEGW